MNISNKIRFFICFLALTVMIAFMPFTSTNNQAYAASKKKLYSNTTQYTLYIGSKSTFAVTGLPASKLKKVKWKTSDKKIVKLTGTKGKTNVVKALRKGKATVTARYGKNFRKFQIRVKPVPIKKIKVAAAKEKTVTGTAKQESYVGGVIYQQSAEVAAMYKQVFELAKLKLNAALADPKNAGKKLAIVTDIDATLMDDSTYIAGALLNNQGRVAEKLLPWDNNNWSGYYSAVASTADNAVPGAKEFINYAYSKGVEIYYITNRPYYELDLTVQQLKHAGFHVDSIVNDYKDLSDPSKKLQEYHYWSDGVGDKYNKEVLDYKKNVLDKSKFEMDEGGYSLKGDYRVQVQGSDFSSDKASRRNKVQKKMDKIGGKVIMYMGDSINDMISKKEYKFNKNYTEEQALQFDRSQGNDERTEAVMNKTWKDKWGTEFIVMPNSAYGDWQKATWFNKSITPDQQIDAQRAQLWSHSYWNTDKFSIWYNGPSPIQSTIQ